jgi:exopolysaccharide biosynthesis WecB/TagA/CpsF family protein
MPTDAQRRWHPLPHIVIGGLKVAVSSRADLAAAAVADCRAARREDFAGAPRLVFDSNGHALSLRRSDPAYARALEAADVVHADGAPIVAASRLKASTPIPERSATTDLIHDLAGAASAEGLSFYLLGGSEEVNAACAARLCELYPRLEIAGRRNGYFTPGEEEAIVADINAARPDILWVGLGKPKEQIFAAAHRERIRAGWLVTCGGCFNFVTGHYRRAPQWMQAASLEWLHRMGNEPRKLFWRYLVTTPHALWLLAATPAREQ